MRKKYFSLLELIITLVVITIASTAVGIKINTLIEKQRFESSCKRVLTKISFAKKLALTNQSDVFLAFSENNNSLLLTINFAPIEKISLNESLSHIHAKFIKGNGEKNDFVINFYSKGNLSPIGKIKLFDSKREKIINLEDLALEEFWQK